MTTIDRGFGAEGLYGLPGASHEDDVQDVAYLVFAHDYYLSFSNELNLLNMKSLRSIVFLRNFADIG